MRNRIQPVLVAFLLLASGAAQAAYWVESIAGPAGNCQLVRDGQTGALKVLMLLRERDRISTAEGCVVVLAGASNERLKVTPENSPFVVPTGDVPPTVLENIADWVVSWYNNQSRQEFSQVSAVVRGTPISMLPVLIEGAGSERNKMLAGTRSVAIRWTGGTPPYTITMVDSRDQAIATYSAGAAKDDAGGVHGAALAVPELRMGDYQIRVRDEQSTDSIRLTVVPESEEPANAAMFRTSDMPDNIRQSYRAIVLASLPEWRFQALQVAAANGLESIAERLILSDFPEPPAMAPASGK